MAVYFKIQIWSLNLLALYVWRCPWRCVLLVSHFPFVIRVMLLMFRWQRRKQSRAHNAVNILYICLWFSFISVELQLIILKNVSKLAYCLTTMSLQLKCIFLKGLKPREYVLLCKNKARNPSCKHKLTCTGDLFLLDFLSQNVWKWQVFDGISYFFLGWPRKKSNIAFPAPCVLHSAISGRLRFPIGLTYP